MSALSYFGSRSAPIMAVLEESSESRGIALVFVASAWRVRALGFLLGGGALSASILSIDHFNSFSSAWATCAWANSQLLASQEKEVFTSARRDKTPLGAGILSIMYV